MTCNRCQTASSGEALFCHGCGFPLRKADFVECDNHTGTEATGVCVICGKPVCDDCSLVRGEKVYCDDASHAELPLSNVKLGATASEFEADLVAQNLSANGVSAVVFSGVRHSQFCRLTDNVHTSLYVRGDARETALRLLNDMDLSDFFLDQDTLQ